MGELLLATAPKVAKKAAGDRDFLAYLLMQNRLAAELGDGLPLANHRLQVVLAPKGASFAQHLPMKPLSLVAPPITHNQ